MINRGRTPKGRVHKPRSRPALNGNPVDLGRSPVEARSRFRFPNPEQFGTISAVQPFNRFPFVRAGNRLQDAV